MSAILALNGDAANVVKPQQVQHDREPTRYALIEPNGRIYNGDEDEANIQFQYQGGSGLNQPERYWLGRDYYNSNPERRRYTRQVAGTYYPPTSSSSAINPRYQINERSQYQLQANAQRHAEGDYNNYDQLNSRYQSQEQAAYYRQRSRLQ